jgi:hypothetical protein
MGLRQVGSGFDITETVIDWTDNAGVQAVLTPIALLFASLVGAMAQLPLAIIYNQPMI